MEDFIKEIAITQNTLAVAIGVPPRRINQIVHGQRRITADTALRQGRYFSMDPQFWINLQSHYDLEVEMDTSREAIAAIEPLRRRRRLNTDPCAPVEKRPPGEGRAPVGGEAWL